MASSSSSVTPSRRWSGSVGSLGHGHRDPAAPTATGPALAARAALSTSDRMMPKTVVGAQDRLRRPFRMGHQAGHVAGRVHDPGDRAERAVRVGRIVGSGGARPRRRRSGRGPGRRARARRASRRPRRSGPRRARRACRSGRRASSAWVNGVSSRSAAMATRWPANRSDALRNSAPGTSPASARTWNPLQMPRTSPPSAAKAATARITGLNRAMTPGPDVVAVGEATRQDDRGDAVERRLLVPQDDRFRADQVEGVDGVAVAVAAREDDDPDPDGHRQPSPTPAPAVAADDAAPSGSIAKTSISGFDRSSPASRSTMARAAASSAGLDASARRGGRSGRRGSPRSRDGRGCPRPRARPDRGCPAWA